MKQQVKQGKCKLHSVKFYNLPPGAITSMRYNEELAKLGVVRDDARIEIWNLRNAPFLERTIPGGLNCSVESIAWAGKRLFSVGLQSTGLTEWNLKTLQPKRNLLLTGTSAFCLDINQEQTCVAVGTEEGYLNVFDISDDEFQFGKILDKQEGRIVCCKFDHTGKFLVTGSLDALRVFNVETGHVIHKMTTGRTEKKHETIIWCMEVLSDFTILSGDSRGRVTIWDGNLGSQKDWVQALKADVLCLAVSKDEKSFYCSGVEQSLKKYTRITSLKENHQVEQWVKIIKRSTIHTHDVRAIATVGQEKVVSGGVDGFFAISTNDLKSFTRLGPFLQRPFACVAEEARLILFKYSNYLEVWNLGKAGSGTQKVVEDKKMDDDDIENEKSSIVIKEGYFQLQVNPSKLLELRSKDDEQITCTSISRNGKWLLYSTMEHIRLYRFEANSNSQPNLDQMHSVPTEFTTCLQATFSPDSKLLVLNKIDGTTSIFELSDDEITHKQTLDVVKHIKDFIHLVSISHCSKYIVFADVVSNISIWKTDNIAWSFYSNLPKYNSTVTAMQIQKNSTSLVVAFANQKLFEYNIEDLEFEFSTQLSSLSSTSAISNICLDPRNHNVFVFHKDDQIIVLDKSPLDKQSCDAKKKKKLQNNQAGSENYSIKTIKCFSSHLAHLEWLSNEELVAVEVNPIALIEQLGAPLRRKRYGLS